MRKKGKRTKIRGWSAWSTWADIVNMWGLSLERGESLLLLTCICVIMLLGGVFLFSSLNSQLSTPSLPSYQKIKINSTSPQLHKKKKKTCGFGPVVDDHWDFFFIFFKSLWVWASCPLVMLILFYSKSTCHVIIFN